MPLSNIGDKISQKLQERIQDKTRRQLITELLDLEVRYISEYDSRQESANIKIIKKDFQYLMDQYYPVGE